MNKKNYIKLADVQLTDENNEIVGEIGFELLDCGGAAYDAYKDFLPKRKKKRKKKSRKCVDSQPQ